ncbi:MAG: rhomboid family intramembrane serine protease [Actinobacteria bacterium]|nr:rhomboid family intramembrane serine protease [Actinomycetota bacterium]PLS85097.1 MAG: rhomboid family intramembrane serine protease [Actinomycetota bacterium]
MAFSRLPVTFSLIAACVIVYVGLAGAGSSTVGSLCQPGGGAILGSLIPLCVAEGQPWRLVTSIFLHSGITHLLLNMLSLYFLGSFAEATFGRGRFFAMYGLSGIAGGLAYLYWSVFTGAIAQPAVGASGAIFGLLGGVFGYAIRRGTFSARDPVIGQLLFLTALNLFLGFSIPNVSNAAHLGGLAGGLVYGFLLAPTVFSQKRLAAFAPAAITLGIEALLLGAWYLLVV